MNNNSVDSEITARGAARPGGLRSHADECPFDLAKPKGRTKTAARPTQITHRESQTPSPLASRRPLVKLVLFIPTFIPLAPFIPSSEGARTGGSTTREKPKF